MLHDNGYPQPAEPHPLQALPTVYAQPAGGSAQQTPALTAVAREANTPAAAVFVVENNKIIVPQLDANHLLVSWTKQTVEDRSVISTPLPETFICDVRESDLEMLIGEYVQ